MTTESPVLGELPQTSTQSQVGWLDPRVLPFPLLIAAAATALLLWMSHFPLSWGWLAWVALVPFLCLARSRAPVRAVYFSSWVAGLLFFFASLQWMRVADYRMVYTWIMLAIYCSAYFPVALWLIRKLDRKAKLPLLLSVPIVWVGLEFIRSFMLTGFAWYYLGHTQHDYLAVIQISDLTGVYGVSFLIAMANACVFGILYRAEWFRSFFRLPTLDDRDSLKALGWQSALTGGLIVAALVYGMTRLEQEDFKPGPRLGILQGNLDQRLRNEASSPQGKLEAKLAVTNTYFDLCKRAMAQYPAPDLLVWPETSYPATWIEIAPAALNHLKPEIIDDVVDRLKTMEKLAAEFPTNHLLGLNSFVIDENRKLNHYCSALHINDKGKPRARFDKMHRVPFGEYVPFVEWLPFLRAFAPYDDDYDVRQGEHFTLFQVERKAHAGLPKKSFLFGVLICYEDTDPVLARSYLRTTDGPSNFLEPVDFLINISNESWFDGTSEHEEHLAICRFRAIECRRAVARSVNMGISAIIDSNGRVQKPQVVDAEEIKTWIVAEKDGRIPDLASGHWSDFKKVSGVLMATIPIDDRFSLYTVVGDWLPWMCWFVVIGLLVRSRLSRNAGTMS